MTGATTDTLILTNVSLSDSASYTVVVTNPAGSFTSSVAALTVTDPPVITTQPQNSTNRTGTSATFTVAATGESPLRYQWYFNCTNLLPDATSATLSITNVHRRDAGQYWLVVTNQYAAVTSAVATLTLQNTLPVAASDTLTRVAGLPLKIPIAALLANDTDADEDLLSLAGISLVTSNGVHVATNGTGILYPDSPNVADRFTYTISDGWGGVADAAAFITVTTNVFVQAITITNTGPGVTATFTGIPGYDYQVQRSTNLIDWVVLVTTNAPSTGIVQVTDDFADIGEPSLIALYRLRFLGYTP